MRLTQMSEVGATFPSSRLHSHSFAGDEPDGVWTLVPCLDADEGEDEFNDDEDDEFDDDEDEEFDADFDDDLDDDLDGDDDLDDDDELDSHDDGNDF